MLHAISLQDKNLKSKYSEEYKIVRQYSMALYGFENEFDLLTDRLFYHLDRQVENRENIHLTVYPEAGKFVKTNLSTLLADWVSGMVFGPHSHVAFNREEQSDGIPVRVPALFPPSPEKEPEFFSAGVYFPHLFFSRDKEPLEVFQGFLADFAFPTPASLVNAFIEVGWYGFKVTDRFAWRVLEGFSEEEFQEFLSFVPQTLALGLSKAVRGYSGASLTEAQEGRLRALEAKEGLSNLVLLPSTLPRKDYWGLLFGNFSLVNWATRYLWDVLDSEAVSGDCVLFPVNGQALPSTERLIADSLSNFVPDKVEANKSLYLSLLPLSEVEQVEAIKASEGRELVFVSLLSKEQEPLTDEEIALLLEEHVSQGQGRGITPAFVSAYRGLPSVVQKRLLESGAHGWLFALLTA